MSEVVTFEAVSAAAIKIRGGIERTPCEKSHLSELLGMELYFKKDFLQYTGSFKDRGARLAMSMLSAEERERGVITASGGNHAIALAYQGRCLDIPVTIVMPYFAPLMKTKLCRSSGAKVIDFGNDMDEAKEHAMRQAKDLNMQYISGCDHVHVIAGQGTMGLEIVDQVSDLDAVIVPVGGGGLIAGLATAIKTQRPNVKIYGVESEKCQSFTKALDAGKPTRAKTERSIAEGLSVPTVGSIPFATVKAGKLIDKMLVVSEEYIALALLRLVEMEKAVVEGAGAIGLAAVLQGLVPELKGKKVVIPLGGGNIDTNILSRCLDEGLIADGRLCRFVVVVEDRAGCIARLTKKIAAIGVNLKDMVQERAWIKSDVFSVQVKCVVETKNKEQIEELEDLLKSNYSGVNFGPNIY